MSTPDRQATLDHYRLIAEIGRGGMAEVHLALSQGPNGFHKLVVVKRVRAHLVEDADARAMLMDEARLAGRLNHPNVVQTHEVAQHEGRPYIVMEYLEGQPFAAILSRSRQEKAPLPLADSLFIVCEALEGLHYLHELKDFDGKPLNLVHRDISPQNIFVTYDGRIKVLDFGIAKAAISESETRAGVLKGKISFMAPEQALGQPVDPRSDLYAVGAVLWDIAVGHRLWKGIPEGHALYRTVQGDIPTPSSVNPDVDRRLEKICLKALALNPADRYPDAPTLLDDLRSLLDSLDARPSARGLGEFVGRLFGDVREETEKIVSERVAELSRRTPSEAPVPALAASGGWNRTASVPTIDADSERISVTGPSGASSVLSVRELQSPPPRKMPGFIVPAVVGIVGVVGIVLALQTRSSDASPPADPIAAAVASTASIPVETVVPKPGVSLDRGESAPAPSTLAITAEPKSSVIFVDGQKVDERPVNVVFDDQRSRHIIRIEANGYEYKQFEVAPGVQTSMHVTLPKSSTARSQPRADRGAAGTKGSEEQPGKVAADVETVAQPTAVAEPTPVPDTARDRIKSLDTSNPWGR